MMSNDRHRSLQDLGERAIIASILPKFADGIGDDCAIIPFGDCNLVATTDPVPPPAAEVIAGDPDPYWRGWLLVTINSSDLAAAGAEPVAFLAAIECPAATTVAEFERFLEGVRDACVSHDLSYVGGNIREAAKFSAVGCALGRTERNNTLTRTGARPSDCIVSIGNGGVFWRDALNLLAGNVIADKEKSPLFRPFSQIKTMRALIGTKALHACMDNSDGLLPTIEELSKRNSLTAVLDFDLLEVEDVPATLHIDPARLWLGWGDWNIIAAVSSADVHKLHDIAKEHGSCVIPIGTFRDSGVATILKRGNTEIGAPRIDSERFALDSWFSSGIEGYVELLRTAQIP